MSTNTKKYLDRFSRATGAQQSVARLSDVLGDSGGSSLSKFLKDAKADAPPDVEDGVGTVVGVVAGAVVGNRYGGHWVLGAIGGASLGRNLPALLDPSMQRTALCNMGGTAAAIAVSSTRATTTGRVAAFVVTEIAANLVCYYGKLR
jgi:hypothetical protein